MKTNVDLWIFLLCTIKAAVFELLSQTTIKFDPFQEVRFLPAQYSNVTTFKNVTPVDLGVKILNKRHVYGREPDFIKFNNLLEQRIHGNTVPQCPCVIKPGSDKCIAYDSRYQAASIEEALVAFRDVTLDEDIVQAPATGIINADVFACRTLECQTCAAILLDRLKRIGMVPTDIELSISFPVYIKPENCGRLRFIRPHPIPNPPPVPDYVKRLIEDGLRYAGVPGSQKIYPAGGSYFWPPPVPPPPPPPPQPPPLPPVIPLAPVPPSWINRRRRYQQQQQYFVPRPWSRRTRHARNIWDNTVVETADDSLVDQISLQQNMRKHVKRKADPPVLGTRFVISCVQRGEVDGGGDDMLTLCGACWTWRKLPADYFPPLINELVCAKDGDAKCLSGWGECQQKYRNFDVLRKVNGDWQPTTIATATCCDCRVRAGTEIHALVVGRP